MRNYPDRQGHKFWSKLVIKLQIRKFFRKRLAYFLMALIAVIALIAIIAFMVIIV